MSLQEKLIQEQDWDVLITLDACNYREFEKALPFTGLRGKILTVDSGCLCTPDWFRDNWPDKNNVNLITAHPMPRKFGYDKKFKSFDPLSGVKDWLEPAPALERLVETQQPGEKYLVHLIPPHLPFLGEKGKEFSKKYKLEVGEDLAYYVVTGYGVYNGWNQIKQFYIENILHGLHEIERFLPRIRGKVVISSDHGEILGVGNYYGHNKGPRHLLTMVPWFEIRR